MTINTNISVGIGNTPLGSNKLIEQKSIDKRIRILSQNTLQKVPEKIKAELTKIINSAIKINTSQGKTENNSYLSSVLKRVNSKSFANNYTGLMNDLKDIRGNVLCEILNSIVDAVPSNKYTPRSVVLDYMIQYMPENEMKSNIEGCKELCLKIEDLQLVKSINTTADKQFTTVVGTITGKIDLLKKNDTMLIPGGWNDKDDVFHDALYEIKKEDEGSYAVRFISVDASIEEYFAGIKDDNDKTLRHPAKEFKNIDIFTLKNSISSLVLQQLPMRLRQPTDEKKGCLGTIKEGLKRMCSDNQNIGISGNVYQQSALDVMHSEYSKSNVTDTKIEEVSGVVTNYNKEIFRKTSTVARTIKAYMRIMHTEKENEILGLEVNTFLNTVENSRDLLVDPQYCLIVYESCRKLITELTDQNIEIDTALHDRLIELFNLVKNPIVEETKINKTCFTSKNINASLTLPDTFNLKTFDQAEIQQCDTVTFPTNIIDNAKPNTITDNFNKAMLQCKQLYDNGHFDILEKHVVSIASQIPLPNDDNFWDKLTDDSTKQTLAKYMFELNRYLFECNGLIIRSFIPSVIPLATATLYAASDKLLTSFNLPSLKISTNTTFHFDASEILEIIDGDTYLRALSYEDLNRTNALVTYFNQFQKSFHIKLDNAYFGNNSYDKNFLIPFFNNTVYKHPIKEVIGPLYSGGTINGTSIDKQIILMRDIRIMSIATIQNNKSLCPMSTSNGMKVGVQLFKELKGDIKGLSGDDLRRHSSTIIDNDVRNQLRKPQGVSKNGRKSLTVKYNSNFGCFDIAGTSSQFLPYAYEGFKHLFPEVEFYKAGGKIISDNIDRTVVSFNIAEEDKTDGTQLTQHSVITTAITENEKLLRNMQTGNARLVNTILTFSEKPQLLDDTSYQRLFELNLLKAGAIESALADSPEFYNALCTFVNSNFAVAMAHGNIKRALFLAGIGSIISRAKPKDFTTNKEIDSDSQYNQLLNKTKGPTPERRAIMVQLIAIQQMEHKTFKTSDYQNIVEAFFLKNNVISDNGYSNNDYDYAVEMAYRSIELKIKQPAINDYIKQMTETFGFTGNISGKYPQLTLGTHTINMSTGFIAEEGVTSATLPDDITQDPNLKPFIADLKNSKCKVSCYNSKVRGETIEIYTFNEDENLRIIKDQSNNIIIQKKIDGHLFEVVPSSDSNNTKAAIPQELQSLIIGNILLRNISDPKSMIIIDGNRKENKKLYSIELKSSDDAWKIEKVTENKTGRTMSIPDATTIARFPSIFGIDDPKHTIVWMQGTSIYEVSFPRLLAADGSQLSYTITENDGIVKMKSKNGSELLLSKVGTKTLPATFRDYHLIAGADGNQQMLMPIKKLVITGAESSDEMDRMAQWSGTARLDHSSSNVEPQKVANITIDQISGKPSHNNDKGSKLYMAYVLFAHKNYDQAMDLMKSSDTSLKLSQEYSRIFEWIKEWPDTTPDGNAFKLHAALSCYANNQYQGITESNLDSMQNAAYIMGLKDKYDKSQDMVHPHLKIQHNSVIIYEKAIKSTLLIFTEISATDRNLVKAKTVNSHKIPIPTKQEHQNWKQAIESNNSSKKTLPEKLPIILPIIADELLVSQFKLIYKTLLSLNNKDLEFTKLKNWIRNSMPTDADAITAKSYLLMFIQMDNNDSDLINELRSAPEDIQEENIWLRYEDFINSNTTENQTESSNIKIKNEMTEEESGAFKQVKNMYGEEDVTKLDFDFILKLEEEGKLTMLAKSLRIDNLRKRLKEIDGKLKSTSEEIKTNHTCDNNTTETYTPKKILKLDFEKYFSASTMEIVTADITQKIELITLDNTKPESSQRLAASYKEDTKLFATNIVTTGQYQLNDNETIKTLNENIIEAKNKITGECKEAEKSIISVIKPTTTTTNTLKNLISPSMEAVPKRLIGLFIEGDITAESIKSMFDSELDSSAIQSLKTNIRSYMDLSVQERLITSTSAIASKIENNTNSTLNSLHTMLSTVRSYDPSDIKSDELLSIEFVNGFILKQEQVDTIKAMLSNPNQIKQLAMGGGKSSVLLPLLLRRIADKKHMAIGVIPEWLYGAVSQDLDTNCRELFGQDVIRFEFDRDVDADEEWLLRNYTTLADAITNGSAIITTKTSMLSFRDKFIDLMNKRSTTFGQKNKDNLDTLLNIIAKTLTLFKKQGSVIADEVDAILDVRQELNYSINEPEKLNCVKTKVGVDIYKKIKAWSNSNDETLKKLSLAVKNNEQASLNDDDRKFIQRKLAKDIYTELFQANNKQPIDEGLFTSYLCGDEIELSLNSDGIPIFLSDTKICQHKDFIIYARQYISTTLSTTLTRINHVHYGRSHNGSQTIPFKASNTPSDAEFGEEFERIAYCAQDYMQNGLSLEQAQGFVGNLCKQIDNELHDAISQDNPIYDATKTKTYIDFKEKYPEIDIIKASKDTMELKRFAEFVSADSDRSLEFLENCVLPSITIATKQVSSNSFDFCDMFQNFRGFTGTTWNLDTFHPSLSIDGAKTQGTDGKSIHFLLSNPPEIKITTIDSKNPESFITTALATEYNSLIDAGAYLHGIDNNKVAEKIKSTSPVNKANVVFIDDNNEKVVLGAATQTVSLLSSRKDIQAESRISYYDQAHTIGTDIAHTNESKALVTISEKMYIKDLLQSIWRMRKLGQGQKIDFLISPQIKSLIKSFCEINNEEKLNVEHVINFCIHNQAEREADDNMRAQLQQIQGRVPNAMLQHMISLYADKTKTAFSCVQSFKTYKKFLVKDSSCDIESLASINSKIAPIELLENLKGSLNTTYKKSITNKPDTSIITNAMEGNLASTTLPGNKLPKSVDNVQTGNKESQVKTQRQQQQQVSVEMLDNNESIETLDKWKPWLLIKNNIFNLETLWERIITTKKVSRYSITMESVSEAVPGLDNRIVCSPNFALNNGTKTDIKPLKTRILGKNRIPVHQVVIIKNSKGEFRAICVDSLDYEQIIMKIKKEEFSPYKDQFQMAVYDIRQPQGNILINSSLLKAQKESLWSEEENVQVQRLLAQTKFFAGQFNIMNKDELDVMRSWFKEMKPDNIKSLRKEFELYIQQQPQFNDYGNSSMKKLFDELLPESNFSNLTKNDNLFDEFIVEDIQILNPDNSDDIEIIKKLPTKLIQYLVSDEQRWQLVPDQIKDLNEYDAFRSKTMADLLPEHVQYLNTDLLKHLACYDDNDHAVKRMMQIQAVGTGDKMKLLTGETQFKYFDKNQIAEINQRYVQHLKFSQDIAGGLIGNQLQYLKTKDQIRKVDPESVNYLIGNGQFTFLNGYQLAEVAPERVKDLVYNENPSDGLIANPFKYLATPDQINKVDSTNVMFLVGAGQVDSLNEDQVNNLDLKRKNDVYSDLKILQTLPDAKVKKITNPEFIENLSNNQIQYITNKDMFQYLTTTEQIQKVDKKYFEHLTGKNQLAELSELQVLSLDPTNSEDLKIIQKFGKEEIAQIQWLNEQQVPFVTATQVPFVTATQVPLLNANEQFKWLGTGDKLKQEQIDAVKPEQINFLKLVAGDSRFKLLQQGHVEQLGIKDNADFAIIKMLPQKLIHHLTDKKQFEQLGQQQVEALSCESLDVQDDAFKVIINHLTPTQIKWLTTEEQKKSIEDLTVKRNTDPIQPLVTGSQDNASLAVGPTPKKGSLMGRIVSYIPLVSTFKGIWDIWISTKATKPVVKDGNHTYTWVRNIAQLVPVVGNTTMMIIDLARWLFPQKNLHL